MSRCSRDARGRLLVWLKANATVRAGMTTSAGDAIITAGLPTSSTAS
jgi:hypothetical protein